ncbi:MAG: hypothetical protein ACRC80_08630 [Waterburya sp.]
MSAITNIKATLDYIIDLIKGLRNSIGVPTALATAEKGTIVGAINEVNAKATDAAPVGAVVELATEFEALQTGIGDPSFDFLSAAQARYNAA